MSPASVSWSTSTTSTAPCAKSAPGCGATIVTFTLNRFVNAGTEVAAIERGGTREQQVAGREPARSGRGWRTSAAQRCFLGACSRASTSGPAAASSWRRVRRTARIVTGARLGRRRVGQATSRSDDSAAESSASTDPQPPQWSSSRRRSARRPTSARRRRARGPALRPADARLGEGTEHHVLERRLGGGTMRVDDRGHSRRSTAFTAAEDLHLVGVHRLERVVLGLEPHAPVLAEEPLHGRVLVTDEGDDDLAVSGVGLLADDDQVAVEDACVDHGVALDRQHEVGVGRQTGRARRGSPRPGPRRRPASRRQPGRRAAASLPGGRRAELDDRGAAASARPRSPRARAAWSHRDGSAPPSPASRGARARSTATSAPPPGRSRAPSAGSRGRRRACSRTPKSPAVSAVRSTGRPPGSNVCSIRSVAEGSDGVKERPGKAVGTLRGGANRNAAVAVA